MSDVLILNLVLVAPALVLMVLMARFYFRNDAKERQRRAAIGYPQEPRRARLWSFVLMVILYPACVWFGLRWMGGAVLFPE